MRDSSIPCPPQAQSTWSSAELALNHAAQQHAEHIGRMQVAGAQLAARVRHAVNVQRLSVANVAQVTGLEPEMVAQLVGELSVR